MHAKNLPAAWSSTENALEALAFLAKDSLLTIDDFCPAGPSSDVEALHKKADRVLRGQGNNSGRQRCRPDGTPRPPKPPRGTILSTGEDVPKGKSLRARVFVVDVEQGSIDAAKLAACQKDAAAGLYAQAMAGFLAWLAPNYGQVKETLRQKVETLRDKANSSGQHRRTPEIVADLIVGMGYFLQYARSVGAISQEEYDNLLWRGVQALEQAGQRQIGYQQASDPVQRYQELLRAALASGRAHVAALDGRHPVEPSAWGWRLKTIGTGDNERNEWQPQGERIGWTEDEDLYLEPEASFIVARRMGADSGDGITISRNMLDKLLRAAGLLLTKEEGGYTIRKRGIENSRKRVLHLHASCLISVEPGPSVPPGPKAENEPDLRREEEEPGRKSGPGFADAGQESGPKTCPTAPCSLLNEPQVGQVGQMGQIFTPIETPEHLENWPEWDAEFGPMFSALDSGKIADSEFCAQIEQCRNNLRLAARPDASLHVHTPQVLARAQELLARWEAQQG